MHLLAHFFCRLFLHLLALALSSSLCLAAENDDVRRKDNSRPPKIPAASETNGRHPASAVAQNTRRWSAGRTQSRTTLRDPKAAGRAARRFVRTRRLVLAALRVWELKNGYHS